MSIKSTGNIHINHQICLSSDNDFTNRKHKRLNLSNHEFDSFNPQLQEYLSKINTRQSKDDVIDWIKSESPIAAITMVFNCAINHSQSINLLNRFYDHLCKYQFGRTYKKRRVSTSQLNRLRLVFSSERPSKKGRLNSQSFCFKLGNSYLEIKHTMLCSGYIRTNSASHSNRPL